MDIAVHTKDIINHVIHVNPLFKNSSSKSLLHGFTNSLDAMDCLFVVLKVVWASKKSKMTVQMQSKNKWMLAELFMA
jgi:hypothetical protein